MIILDQYLFYLQEKELIDEQQKIKNIVRLFKTYGNKLKTLLRNKQISKSEYLSKLKDYKDRITVGMYKTSNLATTTIDPATFSSTLGNISRFVS